KGASEQPPGGSPLQGQALKLGHVEPWPQPAEGAAVLNEIAERIKRYVVLPDFTADVIALWCAHTHCFEAFLCSPRLNVTSPARRCGKTTLRDVIAQFVPRAVRTENLTTAVLFRLVDAHRPVVLADEYDKWLRDKEELCSLLNAGHRRGG